MAPAKHKPSPTAKKPPAAKNPAKPAARGKPAARNFAPDLPGSDEPEPLPIDVPTAAEFARATAGLSAGDRAAVRRTVELLAGELGSEEAARLWFVTPSAEFRTVPLDELPAGNARLLLALVEAEQGPGPAYG